MLAVLGLRCQPSQANFLLVSMPAGFGDGQARRLYTRLMEQDIYVRWFDEERLRTMLRVSIGTPEENTVLVEVLKRLLDEQRSAWGYPAV